MDVVRGTKVQRTVILDAKAFGYSTKKPYKGSKVFIHGVA
jgi:hypothetical protein